MSVGAPIVDAHHHLWDLRHHRYPWLQDQVRPAHFGDYAAIRRDYLIADYLADAADQNIIRSVHVEAGFDPTDPVAETRWLQGVADAHGFPHGIVANVDLTVEDAQKMIEAHAAFPNLRGIRMMLRRPDELAAGGGGPSALSNARLRSSLRLLPRYGLSFDLQAPVPLMEEAAALCAELSDVTFVLTHLGLPIDRSPDGLTTWHHGLARLAALPNVVCKISGLPMTDHVWTVDSLRPMVLTAIDLFGPERAMLGSNFPVDKLFSSFARLFDAYRTILADLSESECHSVFQGTARRIYRL